jgi:hypothetical protein
MPALTLFMSKKLCKLLAQVFQPVPTAWRARRPTPPTFSCLTDGLKAHEGLLCKNYFPLTLTLSPIGGEGIKKERL